MTREDVISILRVAAMIGGSATPIPGVIAAAQVIDYLLKQAEFAGREAGMTDAEIEGELAQAKADRNIADDAWDELVRQARETET